MNVVLPSGRRITGVPEGTSKREIAEKAIKHGLATAEDFRETAPTERRDAAERATREPGVEAPGALVGAAGAIKQGATFGFSDEIEGMIAAAAAAPFVTDKTFRELYKEARDSGRAENTAFREDNPKTALALNVAGGAMTLPAGMAAQMAARPVAAGATAGAVAGAGFSEGETAGEIAGDAAVGGALGAAVGWAAPKLASAIAKKAKDLLGKQAVQVYDDAGRVLDDIPAAVQQKVAAGEISKEEGGALLQQIDRYNKMRRHGIDPNRFNLTQATDDSANLQSATKRSGPVAAQVARQDAQLADDVSRTIDRTSPAATDLPSANASVYRAVEETVGKVDEAVSAAYQQADKVAGQQFRVKPERFLKAIQDARGPELNKPVVSQAIGILRNRGILKSGAGIDPAKGATRTGADNLKQITVREAEAIRQELNQIWDSVTPQGRRVLRHLKDALDDDVDFYAAEKDIFKAARSAKEGFHRMIERGARNKFDTTRGGFLEDVINNAIPEEKIIPRLVAGRDDDLLKFKDFLLKDAGDTGKQAWNDIRAQVLRGALDKATSTMGKGEGGQAVFNARLFRNALQPLMKSKKFEAMFSADERKYIQEIIEIGNLRVPVSIVQQGKGPTELAVKEARQAIISKIPFGERVSGLLEAVANYRVDRRMLDATADLDRAMTR